MSPGTGFKAIIVLFCLLHPLAATSIAALKHISDDMAAEPHRSLLQVQDVLSHLHKEHVNGNYASKFTVEIRSSNTIFEIDVIESQPAILPAATYSIHNRPSREVGNLGYFNLVSGADGTLVSLTVNPGTGKVRGVVKRISDEGWISVGDDVDGVVMVDSINRVLEVKPPRLDDNLPTTPNDRGLQAFHSNYFYQADIHLDIDYEFILHNGGSLCNAFSYINSLITAANVVFEKEVMVHLNVASIQQTDVYDEADNSNDALEIMKKVGVVNNVDLHFALLGKKLQGELGERGGISFAENSLCDRSRAFGLVSGLNGSFVDMDQQFGQDLKRLMYALARNFGSGPFGGELESLVYTFGGHWTGIGDIGTVNSWDDSPYLGNRKNIPFAMFKSASDRSVGCLEISPLSELRVGPISESSALEKSSVTTLDAKSSKANSGKPNKSPKSSKGSKKTTTKPTNNPVKKSPKPTRGDPTRKPTTSPPTTLAPTVSPTKAPTNAPTNAPVRPGDPTRKPTTSPPTTLAPTVSPTKAPTNAPTNPPTTLAPTVSPTKAPTRKPTTSPPTTSPTKSPTRSPTKKPVA